MEYAMCSMASGYCSWVNRTLVVGLYPNTMQMPQPPAHRRRRFCMAGGVTIRGRSGREL